MELTAAWTLDRVVREALAEDVGSGDLTTDGLVDPDVRTAAGLVVNEPGVVSGLAAAEAVFQALDTAVLLEATVPDGTLIETAPTILARVEGPARALLTGERTALNFLGRLSGIATLTRRYVDAVEGMEVVILDTRKTAPGLRALEKEAVRHGGGTNHRLGLFDAILVKDNHLRLAGSLTEAVRRLQETRPGVPIEVEVESLEALEQALQATADRILLDNMPPSLLRAAVAATAGRVPLEASGGVTLDTVREIAETGVDFISVGALTHSARSLDVSMEVM